VADYEKQLGKFKDQRNAELATALRDKQPWSSRPTRSVRPCWRPAPNWPYPAATETGDSPCRTS
jgi:hypothetical protein